MSPTPLEFVRHPETVDPEAAVSQTTSEPDTPLNFSTATITDTATSGVTPLIDDDTDDPTSRILARPPYSAWPG